ncbi:MAG: transposase [Candidatus Kerfeldbacteria bacterium]|nr:transposase [Candidatus Kerfeldbacteria bacterium]
MYTHHIPVYARFQWLNHPQVTTFLSRFLKPPKKGRKGYDKVWLFRWLLCKHLVGCSYRDLESMGGIDYSTFIKFRKRLTSANWFARLFKMFTAGLTAKAKRLHLVLDSSFVEACAGEKEQGAEYSGYYEKTGFKLHQIIDYETRLPILQTVSPGARADVVWGKRLIRSAPKGWKVSAFLADKGYDSEEFVGQLKQKWRRAEVGIPLRRTTQKIPAGLKEVDTLNWKLKASGRNLSPMFLNARGEIERHFSRKKRVFRLGEERTRHLKNFRVNCYMTSIMEILEWLSKPEELCLLFTKLHELP